MNRNFGQSLSQGNSHCRSTWNRRDLLRMASLGLLGSSASGWFPLLANEHAADPRRQRRCILLWMNGGPSQTDTFDMKPGHANGGEFKEIATNVPGIRISEHLPRLAQHADQLAILRGVSTKEGDHGRGTFLMHTGHAPDASIRYPTLGSLLSKQMGSDEAELPNFVSVLPIQAFNPAAFGPGFLGPKYAAAIVGEKGRQEGQAEAQSASFAELGLDSLHLPEGVDTAQAERRLQLWESLQGELLARRGSSVAAAHDLVYRRAVRLMYSKAAAAFDLSEEPDKVREAYGRGRFGQGCLMARRLVERGVPFVEVSLGSIENGSAGWDTHQNNFTSVQALSTELDNGWASLMSDLKERGLLELTTILWMGEFGRTPRINNTAGRDHFPAAWTCVLAGGGIKGGQAYGRTSADGMTVEDGQVGVGDVLATLCKALGVDHETSNISDVGRPIQIAEGKPIADVLA